MEFDFLVFFELFFLCSKPCKNKKKREASRDLETSLGKTIASTKYIDISNKLKVQTRNQSI